MINDASAMQRTDAADARDQAIALANGDAAVVAAATDGCAARLIVISDDRDSQTLVATRIRDDTLADLDAGRRRIDCRADATAVRRFGERHAGALGLRHAG